MEVSREGCEQARGGGIGDAPFVPRPTQTSRLCASWARLATIPLGKVRAGGVVAHGLAKHERGGPMQQARGGGEFGDASWPPTQT